MTPVCLRVETLYHELTLSMVEKEGCGLKWELHGCVGWEWGPAHRVQL